MKRKRSLWKENFTLIVELNIVLTVEVFGVLPNLAETFAVNRSKAILKMLQAMNPDFENILSCKHLTCQIWSRNTIN